MTLVAFNSFMSRQRRYRVPALLLLPMIFLGGAALLLPVRAEFALPSTMADGSQVSQNVFDRGWPSVFWRTGECPINGCWTTRTVHFSFWRLAADMSLMLLTLLSVAILLIRHRSRRGRWLRFSVREMLIITALIAAGNGWLKYLHDQSQQLESHRQDAVERCIALLKKNKVWQADPYDWHIPTEDGFYEEVKGVLSSNQSPELALDNMCAHCMGMLQPGTWRTGVDQASDLTEDEVIKAAKTSDDPIVRIVLLIGLASSQKEAARNAVVEATADSDPGLQKGACYLVEQCTAQTFGPIGCIHIGSPPSDVEVAAQRIREDYQHDKTFGPTDGSLLRRNR